MAQPAGLYKKTALVRRDLARDLFLTKIGGQIPTIRAYTERFAVSRGLIQQALEQLETEGAVQVEKRGVLGSFLRDADYGVLCRHTGWGSITGTMPIPLTPWFTSLATALCEALSQAPAEISFAYMSGALKRSKTLSDGVYDFMIASRSAARLLVRDDPALLICAELDGAVYSREYRLYFLDPDKRAIEDGMRIGVDPVCLDQKTLTDIVTAGKNVTIVEFPFIGFEDVARRKEVDCVIFRDIGWSGHAEGLRLSEVPLPHIEGFSAEDMNTPVVLVRRDNYGMDRLLRQYLDGEKIRRIQQEVLAGRRGMRFS